MNNEKIYTISSDEFDTYLDRRQKKRYREHIDLSKIMEELDVSSSAGLAFHLKKLVKEAIIEKVKTTRESISGHQRSAKDAYNITPRGKYFQGIISLIEEMILSDPDHQIHVFKETT